MPMITTAVFHTTKATTITATNPLTSNNFDNLRLVFALMVVVYHMGLLSQSPQLAWTLYISSTFAVQAFFVVSGFLVTMSFENSTSLKSYAAKRLRRIAPAYFFVVVAAAVLLSVTSTLPATQYFANADFWNYLAFNSVLLNFSAPALPGVFQSNFETAVNASLWTIKIEAAFYCFVPIMVCASHRFGYKVTLASIFIASLVWKLGFDLAANFTGVEFYAKLAKQLPGQLCFFVGGAWAFHRTRNGDVLRAWPAVMGGIFYAISNGLWHEVFSPFAVTAVVYWAAVSAPKLPQVNAKCDFSYGLYLYHFPIIQSLIAVGLFSYSPLLSCLILFALLGLTTTLSWHFIEAPMVKKKIFHAN